MGHLGFDVAGFTPEIFALISLLVDFLGPAFLLMDKIQETKVRGKLENFQNIGQISNFCKGDLVIPLIYWFYVLLV